jgi:hypothetical protein
MGEGLSGFDEELPRHEDWQEELKESLFSPRLVRNLREKLKVTQKELAILIDGPVEKKSTKLIIWWTLRRKRVRCSLFNNIIKGLN